MSRETVRLTPRERELLATHYEFYRSLAEGLRKPTTPAQRRFIDVCRGRVSPRTEHETAWISFKRLMSLTHLPEWQVVQRGFVLEVVVDENCRKKPESADTAAQPATPPTQEVEPEPPSDRRCSHCGGWITAARLRALPDCRLCIRCQSEAERTGNTPPPSVVDGGEEWFPRSESWVSKVSRKKYQR